MEVLSSRILIRPAETWIEDPDGVRIVLVEVPPGHPLRRDPRQG